MLLNKYEKVFYNKCHKNAMTYHSFTLICLLLKTSGTKASPNIFLYPKETDVYKKKSRNKTYE